MLGSRFYEVGKCSKLLSRYYSTKNMFKFPDVNNYAHKELEDVKLETIFGLQNLPENTRNIIKKNTNEPAIASKADFLHFKHLYEQFNKTLRLEKQNFSKILTKTLFKSIRIQDRVEPTAPSLHDRGEIFTSIFNKFEVILEEELEDYSINAILPFIGSAEHSIHSISAKNIIDEFTTDFSALHKDEEDVSEFYMNSFLRNIEQFADLSHILGDSVVRLSSQTAVKVEWLRLQGIINEDEMKKLKRAIYPDYKISLNSNGITSSIPIEIKTKILDDRGEVFTQLLIQSVIQSVASGSGLGVLTDSRNSIMYEVKNFEIKDGRPTVRLRYRITESSQLKVTEVTAFFYFLLRLKDKHFQMIKNGYSQGTEISSKLLKMIKKSKKDQENAMNAIYKRYMEFCNQNPQLSKLCKYEMIVPNYIAEKIEAQQNWNLREDPLQEYHFTEADFSNSKIYKIENGERILLDKLKDIGNATMVISDAVISGDYARYRHELRYPVYLVNDELKVISHLEQNAQPGLNNPYILRGMISIKYESGQNILSAGQFYITIKRPKGKIKESDVLQQIKLLNQSAVLLGRSPTVEDLIVTNDGKVFLNVVNLDPKIDTKEVKRI